jgi:hypothetical protein
MPLLSGNLLVKDKLPYLGKCYLHTLYLCGFPRCFPFLIKENNVLCEKKSKKSKLALIDMILYF